MRKHPAHRPFDRGFDDLAGRTATANPIDAQVARFERDNSSAATSGGRRKQKNNVQAFRTGRP
jgi:hypothetical protein